jgi:hypothetical protein
MNSTIHPLLIAKRAAADTLLRANSPSNVLAVGTSQRTKRVRIYVQSEVAPGVEKIQKKFGAFDTEVIEIGRFERLHQGPASGKAIGPGFPIRFDTTAPNVNPRAFGTWGATVQCEDSYFILSCNHILAVNGRVPDGTRIVSGELAATNGKSVAFATFLGEGYFVEIGRNTISPADCALARLRKNRIPKKFVPVAPIEFRAGMKVKKNGAVTNETEGTIVDASADVSVSYSFGTFRYNDQILIRGDGDEFAWDGDSGSVVTDKKSGRPIAMVFAEAGEYAVACPLSTVFAELGKLPKFQRKEFLMSC